MNDDEPSNSEIRLGLSMLHAQGFGNRVDDTIHPDDEMYLTLAHASSVEANKTRVEYFKSGYEAYLTLENAARCAGQDLKREGLRFLEFACGFGRLTRYLVHALPSAQIFGTDIQKEGVDFVRERFGVEVFASAFDPQKLEAPGHFDVIFVGSLFSHLPEPRFRAWLSRLYGLLSQGGALIFSTHGSFVAPGIDKDPSGFTFVGQSESGRLDPAEYGSTFVTVDRLAAIAKECDVSHIATVERELWWDQDVSIAGEQPLQDAWSLTPKPDGKITHIQIDRDRARLFGWAMIPEPYDPITELRVLVDDRDMGAAQLGEPQSTEAGVDRRSGYQSTEWLLEGPSHALSPGLHTVAIVGQGSSGSKVALDAREFSWDPAQAFEWNAKG